MLVGVPEFESESNAFGAHAVLEIAENLVKRAKHFPDEDKEDDFHWCSLVAFEGFGFWKKAQHSVDYKTYAMGRLRALYQTSTESPAIPMDIVVGYIL